MARTKGAIDCPGHFCHTASMVSRAERAPFSAWWWTVDRLMLAALKLHAPGSTGREVVLDLGMSQGELALLIGASRPKVNIALTMLQDMGAIARTGSTLTCDTEVLQSIADME